MSKREILNKIQISVILKAVNYNTLLCFFFYLYFFFQYRILNLNRNSAEKKIIQTTIFIIIKPNCFYYFMNEITEWKNIFNLLSRTTI